MTNQGTTHDSISEILEGSDEPVITENHPDAHDIQWEFEGGRLLKIDGTYHIFPTERAGVPDGPSCRDRINTRIGHWVSTDALNWTRDKTLQKSSGN